MKLRTSPSIFELTLQALPDGVLLVDRERRVLYANPAFAQIWSLTDELVQTGDEAAMLRYAAQQLVDPEQFATQVEHLHPSDVASEDELLFKDGRIVSRRSVPFHDGGAFEARIWIFTDITEARYARQDCLTGLKNRAPFLSNFRALLKTTNRECVRWPCSMSTTSRNTTTPMDTQRETMS